MLNSDSHGAAKRSSGASGGAWEAIIDKAVASVTEYLSSTTREFDTTAPLSLHMLDLLDRSSLRDILVERNYNELCGCLGCGNKPRGMLAANSGTLSFEWASSSSLSASDAEDEVNTNEEAAVKATEDEPDVDEEIVYEEDLYTAESFRLAHRQRVMLNRMQRKKMMREHEIMTAAARPASSEESGGITPAILRVLPNGLIGADFSQRFCSPECEEVYESIILRRVPKCFTYDYPSVLGAITNLFPNLRVAALQQLAGAETSAAGLLRPVVETEKSHWGAETPAGPSSSVGALKPVQVGVDFESGETARSNTRKRVATTAKIDRSSKATSQVDDTSSELLLREVLEQMQVLQHVWNNEVVQLFPDAYPPRVVVDAATPLSSTGAAIATHLCGPTRTRALLPHRPALRGSLLLLDFVMNTSCAQTRRLFNAHYASQRWALQRCLATVASPQAPIKKSFFCSMSVDIITELEKRCVAHVVASDTDDRPLGDVPFDYDDEGLRVDPILQQQRREVLVSHIFSEDVTAMLSRLLLLDYVVVANMAWSGVWFAEVSPPSSAGEKKRSGSLLRSFQFPFSIPAVLLQPAASTPEVLGLALVYLVAAGCCSEGVWRDCMRKEVEFDEVAQALGLSREDIAAAVRSLMLGEEK